MTSVMWFRRDLRLHDHPALYAAAATGPVLALFVLDDALLRPAGANRTAFLVESLRSLHADLVALGGRLVVRAGDPAEVLPHTAEEVGATSVHVSEDFGPYGRRRDETVADALGSIPLVRTGSPYAVSPGRVTTSDGELFRVFSRVPPGVGGEGWRAAGGDRPGRDRLDRRRGR